MKRNIPQNKEEKQTVLTVKEETELMQFLQAKMGGMSRNSIKSLLTHGQVYVDNKVQTKYNLPLTPGQKVSIRKNKKLKTPKMDGLRILYEDDSIIVIDKNAGLLTVTAGSGIDITAFSILKEYVQSQSEYNKIFTVHRLDRQTSGVLVFAKSAEVQHVFRDDWKGMVTRRIYNALVEGKLPRKEGTISSYLTENARTHYIYSNQEETEGSKKAITHYKTLKVSPDFSLLEVELETGRKNQIRVHMKDLGHPIIGDKMYGSDLKINRIALHARVLEFYHPASGELMHFETPIPPEFLKLLRNSEKESKNI